MRKITTGKKARLKRERKEALLRKQAQEAALAEAKEQDLREEVDIIISPNYNESQWEAKVVSLDGRKKPFLNRAEDPKSALIGLLLRWPIDKPLLSKKTWQKTRKRWLKKNTTEYDIAIWCGHTFMPGIGNRSMCSIAYRGNMEGVWFGADTRDALMKCRREFQPEEFGVRYKWNNVPEMGTDEFSEWLKVSNLPEDEKSPSTWVDPIQLAKCRRNDEHDK